MTTITDTPARTPQATPDPLFLPAVRAFASEGITPEHVRSWSPSDPGVAALAGSLEAYLTVTGVAAVLAASGPPR